MLSKDDINVSFLLCQGVYLSKKKEDVKVPWSSLLLKNELMYCTVDPCLVDQEKYLHQLSREENGARDTLEDYRQGLTSILVSSSCPCAKFSGKKSITCYHGNSITFP
jgi:hypothetical protein